MIRILVRALVLLLSAAIGLLVAKYTLDDMSISWASFILVVAIFTVLQSVLAPFFAKVAERNAPAMLGGVGLVTTFVSLAITAAISDGLTIDGASTWLLASLIVWLVTMVASLVVPILLVKAGLEQARERREAR